MNFAPFEKKKLFLILVLNVQSVPLAFCVTLGEYLIFILLLYLFYILPSQGLYASQYFK